jgi:hypothetical protein
MIHCKVNNNRHHTKSVMNTALLETRGGAWGFRSRSRVNETDTAANVTTQAAKLRTLGKARSHDANQFQEAAAQFQQAADLLETMLRNQSSISDDSSVEEWATCRLHDSICHLKAERYEEFVAACDSLVNEDRCAPIFRARAYHRRAKAKLALEDTEGALIDARSAAFLGDRKAVTFYGKLLRETGGQSEPLSSLESPMGFPSTSGDSLLASLLSKSSPLENGGDDFLTSIFMGAWRLIGPIRIEEAIEKAGR